MLIEVNAIAMRNETTAVNFCNEQRFCTGGRK